MGHQFWRERAYKSRGSGLHIIQKELTPCNVHRHLDENAPRATLPIPSGKFGVAVSGKLKEVTKKRAVAARGKLKETS